MDSTWHLWSGAVTNLSGYTRRLARDIERLEQKAFEQVAHIFPISEYVRDDLVSHYGIALEKITVAGTGLGVIRPYHGRKDYTNGEILFAAKGRFADKGGTLVLDAFRRAQIRNPNLRLTIVGKNDYKDTISIPNVTVHGFLPVNKLQSIFERSSLFLMPALNEPWGLVYLEALACRVPIVGLNRNSVPEIAGHGEFGFIMDHADPEALANLLFKAFANPDALARMGQAGQQHCLSRYSWDATVKRVLDKIDQTVVALESDARKIQLSTRNNLP